MFNIFRKPKDKLKIALLKKVRKEFEIIHYPKGLICYREYVPNNLFLLKKDGEYTEKVELKTENKPCVSDNKIFLTEVECINFLKEIILNRLRTDYIAYTRRSNKACSMRKKVWYK